jgi:hypothetical protein
VASIDARWDKTLASGRVRIEVKTTSAPAERISADTRNCIKEANTPAADDLCASRDGGDVVTWWRLVVDVARCG